MICSSSSSASRWYCVRTQTKREHLAADFLRKLDGVEVFCPRMRYRKATRRGKVWWNEALFPGYILARFDLGYSERAVTFCQGVRGLVKFGSLIPEVPAAFVENLRHQVALHASGETETVVLAPNIEIGDEVEIASGPFRGLKAAVIDIAPAAERVNVLLDFLGRPQVISLDLFSILLSRRPRVPIPPEPLPA